mgnify:CR=1 FL=1
MVNMLDKFAMDMKQLVYLVKQYYTGDDTVLNAIRGKANLLIENLDGNRTWIKGPLDGIIKILKQIAFMRSTEKINLEALKQAVILMKQLEIDLD